MADWEVDSETPIQKYDPPPQSGGGQWEVESEAPESHWYSGLVRPITATGEVERESLGQMGEGAKQALEGFSAPPKDITAWEAAKRAAGPVLAAYNMGAGAFNALTAPIWGTERAAAEALTKPLPEAKPYAEFALNMATPLGAISKLGPARNLPAAIPPGVLSPEAVTRLNQAEEFGIPLSRGQAERDLDQIRMEDMASRGAQGPEAQGVAAPFFDEQFGAIQQGGRDVGSQLARNMSVVPNPNAAGQAINAELANAAETARNTVAKTSQEAEGEAAAQRGIVSDQGRAIAEAVRGHYPNIEAPQEAGEVVGQAVREQAANERQNFQNLYNEAFGLPGNFHAGAIEGVGQRIKGDLTLHQDPVIIDEVTTPMASRAIHDLDNVSSLRIRNSADPFGAPNPDNIVGVDLRGVDQARKRLVQFYQGTQPGTADRRAVGRIIDSFDDQIERAISNGLFSGDPRALEALQEARGAYRNYAQTFRPRGAGDDVGRAMQRITDRNATPEEIANMIIGSGKLGNAGLPVRIADRLETMFGRDSEPFNAIRQAVWQKASDTRTAAGSLDPQRGATNIFNFVNSSLAQRLFSPEELSAMRSHAQGIRDLDNIISSLPETRAAEHAKSAYGDLFGHEGIGGSQAQAFRRIVEGTATPDETANAIFGAINAGNPGNVSRLIKAVENVAGKDSESMSAVRQGVWQKLTQNADGKDQPGQQKMVQALNEFLHGKGRAISEQLYTPQERAKMQRFADAVRHTIIPKYSRTNSDTAVASAALAHRALRTVASALAHKVAGPLGGHVVSHMIERGVGKSIARKNAEELRNQFNVSP